MSEYALPPADHGRICIHGDIVTVVLRDSRIKGEEQLVDDDLGKLVATMRYDLVNGVETILGRTVVAFMSANHIDPGIAVEVFLLAADAGSQSDGTCGAARMP